MLENHLLGNTADLSPRLNTLLREYRFVQGSIDSPKTFEGMADLDPGYDFPVLPAGDATNPGKIVSRGFLQLVTGNSDGFKVFGSGRREIADVIASSNESADSSGDGQPDLALRVRTRHRSDSR